MAIALTFYGAAETVTGSRFMVEAGGRRILIDCGMFQGLKELRLQNWEPPAFDPGSIAAVFLTHAHIDHSGWLPRLVKHGYRGPIYCTKATAELAEILLLDAAKLQEEDADFANRKGYSKHRPALALFDTRDAHAALDLFEPAGFRESLESEHFEVRFHEAGHILGSAFVEVRALDGEHASTVVFSGDLGRVDRPLHLDPAPPPQCDTLVLESTYGDRLHDPDPLDGNACAAFRRVLGRGGIILIPAFAVARAQLVTLQLKEWMAKGDLPSVPVHIDSPMAVDVTAIYQRYLGRPELDPLPGGLFPPGTRLHRSVAESKELNALKGPRIIISSSGMLTGGRVLHHLERLLPDRNNMIVLVGYQAAGTRGRRLVDGERTVRMHGRDIPVHAEVLVLSGFSAHADRDELVAWAGSGPARPRDVFLVHGERGAQAQLRSVLERDGYRVEVPERKERFELAEHGWALAEG